MTVPYQSFDLLAGNLHPPAKSISGTKKEYCFPSGRRQPLILNIGRYKRTSGQLITTFAETSVGCRTNVRVDAVRPLNRHGLNSRTARDSGVPVVPLVFNIMYDVALPGLGGEKRVYAAGCRL